MAGFEIFSALAHYVGIRKHLRRKSKTRTFRDYHFFFRAVGYGKKLLAAVIDDVLGLIILAVVSGIVTAAELGQPLAIGALLRLIGVAILFLGVAGGLTLAAIIGKQICGLGVLEKGLDRLTIGVGMIPRGEVGLIFASIGKSLKVIDDATFVLILVAIVDKNKRHNKQSSD